MSILISPSNNTGWGLTRPSTMYGGAKKRSQQHPVRVRGHFRAPWGAYKRGRTSTATAVRTTVDDVIDSVVADARNYTPAPSTVDAVIARRHRSTPAMRAARALLRRARRTGRRAMMRAARRAATAPTPAGRTRRRAAAAAAAAISSMTRPRRGNVYWVRDSVTGVRVPVRTRPPRP
ncbi:pVII [Human adenovirus 43]|uniref:Pre-histone-like nucleoprotein n=1 Tax=Human adenovirus 43 TaxID=46938 RepID=M0QVH5_9ADEN|nr:pVII [Human adenovirus 43]